MKVQRSNEVGVLDLKLRSRKTGFSGTVAELETQS